ncbi:Similar to Transposon MAGGYgagandpolgenehomologues, related [Eimeria praecox]|uniref:Similar to Transposon MAGGYgagandpolgenehomologues, related n=1 Tax=Eimeria praecox TaxID=51316 RepID=U6GCE9_9EIME|nr:Similar to Transposon MAGGYgagandpolgenehomologues, related [Eimeria praecox]
MRTYTNAYVESCTQCRASKSINQKPAGLLQQLIIPSRHVSLDFITDLPPAKTGHDSILVQVDSLSKMAHFVPAKKTFTAADTVDVLADRLIRYHGLPEALISDRDPRSQSGLWQQLCARLNIKRALSSSYHPQSDGQTERVHRTLEQMLRTYIQSDEREWERLLPALELAYNTTSHSSTEHSPFEVMIGENPLTAADLDVVGALSPTLTPPLTKLFRQLCGRAQSHILKATCQQKHYADTHRREVGYAEPQEAVVEWPFSRDAVGNPMDHYEVDYIMDQRGSGDEASYLVKWGASRRTKSPRNPLAVWGVALPCCAPGGAVSRTAVRPDPLPSPRLGAIHLPFSSAAARFSPRGGGGEGVQQHPLWR